VTVAFGTTSRAAPPLPPFRVYTIGLYDSLEQQETEYLFPLFVLRMNPLIQTATP